MYIEDNKLVITTKLGTIHSDLPKYIDNNLKHEIEHLILSQNTENFLAERKMKNGSSQILSKYKHGNTIHGHGKQQIK